MTPRRPYTHHDLHRAAQRDLFPQTPGKARSLTARSRAGLAVTPLVQHPSNVDVLSTHTWGQRCSTTLR